MNHLSPPRAIVFAACLCLSSPDAFAAPPPSAGMTPEASEFIAENAAAMDRMMVAMDVTPTGDVDRDFVAMMVPHHQGAIDMAQLVLRHGKNEQIRRIAQEIIVTQQQEIVAMYRAIGVPVPPPAAAPPRPATLPQHPHHAPDPP